jgi:chaperonin cofactor prefoldin
MKVKVQKLQKKLEDVMANAQLLRQKLQKAEIALNDIVKWDDDLEYRWDSQEERANAALEGMMSIDGF